ncbi:MAG: hypothetical protein KAI79_12165 [Bacteroidales bacterium]|nr:hypothetical protein [Bacteroidales bacterium]
MTILDIILLGLMINISTIAGMFVFTLFVYIVNSLIDPVRQTTEFMEVQKKFEELKALKITLKNKKISNSMSDDFKVFLPYSGILILGIFLYKVTTQGMNVTFHEEFQRKIDILELRLDK